MTLRRIPRAILSLAMTILLARVANADEPQVERAMSATFRITAGDASGTSFLVESNLKEPREDSKPNGDEKPKDNGAEGKDGQAGERNVVLVTCAHLFRDAKSDKATVILRAKKGDFDYDRVEHSFPIRLAGAKLWAEHPDQDIAAIRVRLPKGVDAVPFRIDQLAAEPDLIAKRVYVAQETWIPCFPVQIEGHPAGWPILRHGTMATHPLAPVAKVKTCRIDVSSFGGDSGAPVIVFPDNRRTEPPLVAAMCVGTALRTDAINSFYEEKKMHTPLGMAIAVQAAHIRDVIGQMK